MIPSLLLSLREGLEVVLIIGVVLGALHKTNQTKLNRPLWLGVGLAACLSLLAALTLRALDRELDGKAEQIFEGVTFLVAAGMLTWMIFWVRRQSGQVAQNLASSAGRAASLGGGGAIFFLALISVLREGIELALYLTAISLTYSGLQTLLGFIVGLLVAILLGYLLFNTTLRLNLQQFFTVTAVILILFAAGLVAHSIVEFNEAGIIPSIIASIWNLNPILNDHSIVGTILSTLFGYHGTPSLTEALGYAGYLLLILWMFVKPRRLSAE